MTSSPQFLNKQTSINATKQAEKQWSTQKTFDCRAVVGPLRRRVRFLIQGKSLYIYVQLACWSCTYICLCVCVCPFGSFLLTGITYFCLVSLFHHLDLCFCSRTTHPHSPGVRWQWEIFTSMTALSLLMSTSSSGSQEMARNLAPPPRHDTATKAAGRGRRATKPPAQKRPPQRGLGVAQLERLRLRDHWKNMTQMPLPQLRGELQIQTQLLGPPLAGAPLRYSPADYCKASQPSVAYPCQMLGGERGVAVQRRGRFPPYGSDRAVGNLCMAGVRGSAAALEVPRELSSMPNVRCLPDHCAVSVQVRKQGRKRGKKVRLHYRFLHPKYCLNYRGRRKFQIAFSGINKFLGTLYVLRAIMRIKIENFQAMYMSHQKDMDL